MIRKLSSAPLVALACAALCAGCGSSSSSSSSTAATGASTSSTSSTAPGAATTPSSTTTTGGGKLSPAAVQRCKSGVNVLPTLPQKTKRKLETICDKAASGNPAVIGAAAREGCEEIVRASPVPPGAARDRALAGCKSAVKKATKK